MKEKILLLYDLKNKTQTQKANITRKLYGYQDTSNNSNYTYKRLGLLDNFTYKKENKTILHIQPQDKKKIKKILNQLNNHKNQVKNTKKFTKDQSTTTKTPTS